MRSRGILAHPACLLATYLLVPLIINGIVASWLSRTDLMADALVVGVPGAVVVIEWGWTGLAFCLWVGALMGVPVAGLQAAYLKDQLRAVKRGADFDRTFESAEYVLMMTAPWLMGVLVGHLVGSLFIFSPIGGPLIAVNVLWARVFVYAAHMRVYSYGRLCEAEAQGTSPVSLPAEATLPSQDAQPAG